MVAVPNLALLHQKEMYWNSGIQLAVKIETIANRKRTELFSKKKSVGVSDAENKVKTYLLNGVDHVCRWTHHMLNYDGGMIM